MALRVEDKVDSCCIRLIPRHPSCLVTSAQAQATASVCYQSLRGRSGGRYVVSNESMAHAMAPCRSHGTVMGIHQRCIELVISFSYPHPICILIRNPYPFTVKPRREAPCSFCLYRDPACMYVGPLLSEHVERSKSIVILRSSTFCSILD